jgi:hypothetical protein
VLRWLDPREGWWGADEEDERSLLIEVEGQSPDDWPFVLAELLLATAQGKVPTSMRDPLLAAADAALQRSLDTRTWSGIVMGRELVRVDVAAVAGALSIDEPPTVELAEAGTAE